MGAIATHAINPALYPNLPYDRLRDFRHVAAGGAGANGWSSTTTWPRRKPARAAFLA